MSKQEDIEKEILDYYQALYAEDGGQHCVLDMVRENICRRGDI